MEQAVQVRGNNWGFWGGWAAAFLGFPLGGLAGLGLVGGVENALDAAIGGAATGAVIGAAQWLVLRQRSALSPWWIVASATGLGAGLALGVAALGTNTSGNTLLLRGALSGLLLGVAQWLVLRQVLGRAIVWVPTVAVGWALGWAVTRAAGVDLTPDFSVFGSTGAWAFQLLSGLVLAWLLRNAGR